MIRRALLAVVLALGACGGEPPLDSTTGADSAPTCDPYQVGGNVKCSPRPDGTADYVECATYAYDQRTGAYQGSHSVAGCTLDFLASPGAPYTATCVEACP